MSFSFDKQKAIFWGEFIEIAYSMYAPGITNPPQPANFPQGWKLVKNITAEAAAGIYHEKEYIGFVAQSLNDSNEYAVVLHGNVGTLDLLNDFEFLLINFPFVPNGGQTEYGFTKFYESFTFIDPISGASQNLEDYLKGLSQATSFTVAGYSLGGALATLHSAVLAYRKIPVKAYLFASPMVGNSIFVKRYNALVPNSYRIVNKPDIVPTLPGTFLGYQHVKTLFEINSLNSPQVKRSVNCFHSLNVYLHALGAANTNLGSCKA